VQSADLNADNSGRFVGKSLDFSRGISSWHVRDPAGGGRGTSRVFAGVGHKFAGKRHDRGEKGLGKLCRGNFSAFALPAALAQLNLAHRL
jgi:hypothetical protein